MAGLSLAAFTAPQLLALLVDGPLLARASRYGRAPMIALGLLGMAVSVLAAGLAPSLWVFALAFALFSPASGLACGLAQAALLDARPDEREEGMTDWALAGTFGDLAAPLVIAASTLSFGSFRAAWVLVGIALAVLAAFVARLPLGAAPFAERGEEMASLRRALGDRPLVRWVLAAALCALLDETFTALAALFLSERFPHVLLAVPVGLAACTLGGVLGLVLLRRLLTTRSPRVLLALSSAGSVAAYVFWLASGSFVLATVWLFAIGVLVSFQYPLAQAQAYRAAGDRSGLVAALSPIGNALDLVSPLVVGLVADRLGLAVALACLLAQPVGLLFALRAECRR